MRVIDLTDAEQDCGAPALDRVRRAYGELAAGEVIEVTSTVAEHAFAVRAWLARVGGSIVEDSREGARTRIRLRSGSG
ncbi:MAG: sulfurtransferase TusA family protein [Candidatus Dormibacteria bacterium]